MAMYMGIKLLLVVSLSANIVCPFCHTATFKHTSVKIGDNKYKQIGQKRNIVTYVPT